MYHVKVNEILFTFLDFCDLKKVYHDTSKFFFFINNKAQDK